MKDDICDVLLVALAFAMVCVLLALIISKAVSTAYPESAMDEKPTLEKKTVLTDDP